MRDGPYAATVAAGGAPRSARHLAVRASGGRLALRFDGRGAARIELAPSARASAWTQALAIPALVVFLAVYALGFVVLARRGRRAA
jgi:hypothetical protein